MIAIVGGGISGLSAAYELSKRRIPFTLFEGSPRLGGLVRTEHVAGFTIEAGADSMLAQKRAAVDLCSELGLEGRLISPNNPKTAFVLHRGTLHPLPAPAMLGIPATWRGLASYGLLPPSARARIALEPLVPVRRERGDESIASFFGRRFGVASVDYIAQPLLGGIHAGSVARLSLPALFPRLAEAEHAGPRVLRWIHLTAGSNGGSAFRSLATGMGDLVETIHRRLPAASVRCNDAVTALTRSERGWRVATAAGATDYAAVVLACPAHAAAALLAPIDSEAAALCAAVPYVSTVSVALAWPRAAVGHPLQGSGFVVARKSNTVRMTAATWVSSKWDGRAPAGHVLLRAYFGGEQDPAAVNDHDATLRDAAVRELSAILSITGPPELARVYRWPNAGAQHEVGHLARMAALDQKLATLRGLHVTGSGFRSIGIPDCVANGRAVAAQAATTIA